MPAALGVCAGSTTICGGPLGSVPCGTANYGPDFEVDEVSCDGLDNDCDGETDEVDLDADGFVTVACAASYSGSLPATDCDDSTFLVRPGAIELCDGVDQDCNGVTDDRDADDDGDVDAACAGTYSGAGTATDCDDFDDTRAGSIAEVCDNIDNDCDGTADDGALWTRQGARRAPPARASARAPGVVTCQADVTAAAQCNAVAGSPDPLGEQCNGLDDDCAGGVDDNLTAPLCVEQDGVARARCSAAAAPPGGRRAPGIAEYGSDWEPVELTCDGLDNDCDGQTDNNLPASPCPSSGACAPARRRPVASGRGRRAPGPPSTGPEWQAVETALRQPRQRLQRHHRRRVRERDGRLRPG